VKNQIVANLQLFDSEWQSGAKQSQLISEAASLGFENVEIRREYFHDVEEEIPAIVEAVAHAHVDLFYSVPDSVFVDGSLNPMLQTYVDEAKRMGASHIKWAVGDFASFAGDSEELKEMLAPIVSQGVIANVENDQSQLNGTIAPIKRFMEAVRDAGVDLGYTDDIGNWHFTGEDPFDAARQLAPFVRYIHVKDNVLGGQKPAVAPLDAGDLPWRSILDLLPHDTPIGLEFPTASHDVIAHAKAEVEAYCTKR
jgi:sugar phosphate isomerase/epimerase